MPFRLLALAGIVSFITTLFVTAIPQTASAEPSQTVNVGMPFAGRWAYDILTTAPCGPNPNQTSHPQCHEIYYGNWSTDLHAPEGTPVRLNIAGATGSTSFAWESPGSGTCGQRTKVQISVGGEFVGTLYYEHLNNAVTSRSNHQRHDPRNGA